jgi:hypothetical protein
MSEKKSTKERFISDTANHELSVVMDDGIHRNLKFSKPNSSDMHFNITTWPGYLCISGDMGCFVFSRLRDMFEFFRNDKLETNLGYWEEKIQAETLYGSGAKSWSSDSFQKSMEEIAKDWKQYAIDDELDPEFIEEELERFKGELFDKGSEHEAYSAMGDWDEAEHGISFCDYESSNTEYTFHYRWCCFAIVWAIQQYDSSPARADIISALDRHNSIKEFMNSSYGGGDTAIYKGKEYPVFSVDFEEQLVAIPSPYEGCDENEIQWVRCENIEIIPFGVEVA